MEREQFLAQMHDLQSWKLGNVHVARSIWGSFLRLLNCASGSLKLAEMCLVAHPRDKQSTLYSQQFDHTQT